MKKIFTLCVVLCLSYLSMGATNLKHEFRATWLTTAWGNDWPKTKATSDATRNQQQDELIAIFDRLQAGNMNAVCLQVRGRSDAFYQSSYEPWAAELAGARGKDPGYDPLAFAIEEAHKRGLELHAWVNPFRVTSAGTLDANDLVKKNAGQWIIQYNNGSFTGEIIDPGYPEAREYVLNVLMEIISNYDIDGIVMDDYFYPYGGTTTEDAASKALHKPANVVDVNQDGDTDDDWRRSNVDVFLKELYDRIQAKKPWVRFGMGTFGIWTTQTKVAQAYGISLPSGISGLDDYDEQACNPVEWVKNGYVDYINPQLYWPTTSTGQNYNKLCQWWAKDVCEHFSNQLTNGKKVHFFSSQSISSNSAVSEIQAEIDANRSNLSSGYTGSVFFDTDAYLTMDKDLMTSRFATHALPPAMDWKSNTALAAPTNLTVSGSTLTWQHATDERFTVYVYPKGTAWSTAKNDPAYLQGVIYGKSMDISGIDTNANDIAVCAYDRFGVEHTAAVYSNDSGTVTPPASGTITYELNGGVQSEWDTPQDMYNELNAIWNAFSGTSKTWGNLDDLKADVAQGIPTQAGTMDLTFIADENFKAKFEWLLTYMDAKCTEQGKTLPSSNASFLRYNLQAFFIDGMRTYWPISADYTTCGVSTLEAYQLYWKSSFANPTNPTEEFVLNAPYKEGYTFAGWYTNADFSGEKVTTINAETTGTLYAKWINNDWIITYTSTNGNIVTPMRTDVFGANIVSNTYENGVGTITFDGPVTSIGDYAFRGGSSLTSITIPNSVTSIGDYAFSYCSSLTSITIPNGVTSIGYEAFFGCSSLTSITLPNSVTSIGVLAFGACSSLTSITLPNSVTSIGDRAFSGCDSLISIVVEDGNATYDSRTNCNAIIETATNTLIASCQNTIIPNSVTSIGDWAFFDRSSLASITIPNSVTSIGSHAFGSCSSLTSITIPNSVTSIGDDAFYNCSSLTDIAIPNSVTSIGDGAFSYCGAITSMVVENGNTIYDSRENCNAIIETATNTLIAGCQNTIIPNSVTNIGDDAFCGCQSLTSITIPNSVTSIGDYAFYECSALTSITIPSSVKSIGDWAFGLCYSLTSITLPNSVTSIGESAFGLCTSLTSLTIPESVTSIGFSTFWGCSSLTDIAIPNSVTSIGDEAFFGCSSLTSITLPNSVTSIGVWAFAYCSSLDTIYVEATTPPALEDSTVFRNTPSPVCVIPCGTLAAYEASDWAQYVSEFIEEGCPKITYELNGGLPNEYGWQNKNDMFQACMADCGVTTLPSLDEIKATGNDAALTTICTKLTDVSGMLNSDKWEWLEQYIMEVQNAQVGNVVGSSFVPAITTTSGAVYWRYALAAFFVDGQRTAWPYSADFSQAGKDEAYIPAWKQVYTYPTSVTSEFTLYDPYRKGYTFLGWYTNADFSGEKVTTINAETNGTLYAKWINNDWIITYTSTDGNIVTPNATDVFGANIVSNIYENGVGTITFDGPVTSIGENAFRQCSSIASIIIPNSVTSIGQFAFGFCSSLTSITIPENVTSIVRGTFQGCSSIVSIVVDNNNTMYDSRNDCNAIIETATNVLVTGCKNTIIPNGITTIDRWAFASNKSLASITIPNTVMTIADHAFHSCSSLPFISIPNSVTSIGVQAFYNCSLFSSFTIPKSVTTIGKMAFQYCSSLDTIHVEATTPPALEDSTVFRNTPAPICVIPCGTLAAYEASNWASQVGEFVEDCVEGQQIYYTSSNDSIVTPFATDVFGANIVSNTYENGVGTITFDGLVTSIGGFAFDGCSNLASLTIPNSITNIGRAAFQECSSLTSITIPNSVTSIGDFAFGGCSSLTSITIPNSVISIGERAFVRCYSLTAITIPNSVTNIGESAFTWCSSLDFIIVEEGNAIFDSRNNCNAIIETITNTLVQGCSGTTIPNSVINIGDRAFAHCNIISIIIPKNVMSIGYAAFGWCENLETVHIESTTPPILDSTWTFSPYPICYIPCGSLAAYEASDWASQVSEFVEEGCAPIQMCGDNLYWEYADGVLTITGTGDMYDYAADTDVPWYDVRGNIKTVSLPDAMTKIGQNAFYKCTNMTTINMPTSLTAIGEKAFAQDTKLACEIILPASMTTIASRAFFNCKAVTAFHLKATTPPTIPNDAFELTIAPIHVPCGYGHVYGKHTQWGKLKLEMCELLQDNVYYYPIDGHTARAVTYHSNPTDTLVIPSAVVIDGMPRTVTEVAAFAFADCKDIPAIIFNEGLEYIGERAFVRCYGLQGTIVLPATLETIGERAFSYCDNVEKYLIQAMTPPALGANVFTGDNKNALFYISCEAMDDYKVATNWSSLKSRLRDACLNIYHYNTALGANGVHTTEDTLVASIYYRRQFTTSRWETLYLPFEVDRVTVLEDGVEYDLNAWSIFSGGHYYLAKPYGIENKEIVFGFTQVVDAHTPYIIQFTDPYFHDKMITFHGKESWNKLSTSFEALPISFEMQMAGNTTLQDQILEEPVYMLRATSNFILQNTTTTLHPFECYVMPSATSSGTPARMNVRFRGDVPTAVESVKGNESHLTYSVDGYTLTVYPQGQAFSIYSLNGALIYSCEAGKEAVDCELNSGCYLLHAGAEAHKIML